MESRQCPNCAGILQRKSGENKLVCPYCESEFSYESKREEQCIECREKKKLISSILDIRVDKQNLKDKAKLTLMTLCSYLEGNNTLETYELLFRQIAEKNADIAVEGKNIELLEKAKMRLAGVLGTNEKVIFYKDSGIISRAKEGVLITAQKIYFIKKKKVLQLNIGDIKFLDISFTGYTWKINHVPGMEIDSIGCDYETLGIILAMLVTMRREMKGTGSKVVVHLEVV